MLVLGCATYEGVASAHGVMLQEWIVLSAFTVRTGVRTAYSMVAVVVGCGGRYSRAVCNSHWIIWWTLFTGRCTFVRLDNFVYFVAILVHKLMVALLSAKDKVVNIL